MKITWDTKDFEGKISKVMPKLIASANRAVGEAGGELLRLSTMEVPHDTGFLQSTGQLAKKGLEAIVSYNTSYAVRVHESPGMKFQKGRKAKYLEDPFKNNVSIFKNIITKSIRGSLR